VTDTDLGWMDAVTLAELVRNGQVSPLELVDAAIARIERDDPSVNAVVIRRFEQARAEASGELPDGPFRGVPILLKDDQQLSAGDPSHAGCRAVKAAGFVADHDGVVVRHLREAGFVILGRTNVPELCSWPSTEPLAYGPTRNPWDLERTAGGSSGGSAAAVAAGMVPLATGSDGGGSVRLPAAMCGIVGTKPSRGRVSAGPDLGQAWGGLSTSGVLSRNIRDAAALLDVIAGPEPGDPYAPFGPGGPFSLQVGADPGHLRVGVVERPTTGDWHSTEPADAVRRVADLLAGAGHEVTADGPDALRDTSFGAFSRVIVAAAVAAELSNWELRIGRSIDDDELEDVNRWYRSWARTLTGADYVAAEAALHTYARRLLTWWQEDGFDLLVLPVFSGVVPPLGWFELPSAGGSWPGVFNFLGQFNVSGQPALSVPAYWDADGLPVGVQLVAGPGREDILFRVGRQLEDAIGWDQHHPPTAA